MKKVTLTKSIEDYLEAIYILEVNNKPLQSVLIADELKVSKPAVNKAMNELMSMGYIERMPYRDIIFTSKGRNKAKEIYHKHTTIREFLIKLGVDEVVANHDCCLIEHVISKETLSAIEKYNKK
jgi:DtxR family Mn-dependent transcriptional regulator